MKQMNPEEFIDTFGNTYADSQYELNQYESNKYQQSNESNREGLGTTQFVSSGLPQKIQAPVPIEIVQKPQYSQLLNPQVLLTLVFALLVLVAIVAIVAMVIGDRKR